MNVIEDKQFGLIKKHQLCDCEYLKCMNWVGNKNQNIVKSTEELILSGASLLGTDLLFTALSLDTGMRLGFTAEFVILLQPSDFTVSLKLKIILFFNFNSSFKYCTWDFSEEINAAVLISVRSTRPTGATTN